MNGALRRGRALATDDEIVALRDAAERIVCAYGLGVHDQRLLAAIERKGCRVDWPRRRAAITPEVFRTLEACATRHAPRHPPEPAILRRPRGHRVGIGRNIVKIHETGDVRRLAVLEDNRVFARAAQAIPEIDRVGALFSSSDVPPALDPIVSTAEVMKLSAKPFSFVEMMMGEQLPFLQELETIATGAQVRYHGGFASLTRFTIDERAAGCLMAVHEANGVRSWGTNSLPFAGLNAPTTTAGAAAMAMAETIAGWLAGWALDDEIELGLITVAATVDMRTTRCLFATPQAVMIDALVTQAFDRLYGLDAHPGTSMTFTDGKVPGHETLAGKLEKSLALFALTGSDPAQHYGMLEGGSAISAAQLMLDLELNQELARLSGGVPAIDADTIALDLQLELGPDGAYIDAEHTVAHCREEMPAHPLFDRTTFSASEIERGREERLVRAAQDRFDRAVAAYPSAPAPIVSARDVDAVVASASRLLA